MGLSTLDYRDGILVSREESITLKFPDNRFSVTTLNCFFVMMAIWGFFRITHPVKRFFPFLFQLELMILRQDKCRMFNHDLRHNHSIFPWSPVGNRFFENSSEMATFKEAVRENPICQPRFGPQATLANQRRPTAKYFFLFGWILVASACVDRISESNLSIWTLEQTDNPFMIMQLITRLDFRSGCPYSRCLVEGLPFKWPSKATLWHFFPSFRPIFRSNFV